MARDVDSSAGLNVRILGQEWVDMGFQGAYDVVERVRCPVCGAPDQNCVGIDEVLAYPVHPAVVKGEDDGITPYPHASDRAPLSAWRRRGGAGDRHDAG
jgi:hypothetical protein